MAIKTQGKRGQLGGKVKHAHGRDIGELQVTLTIKKSFK